MGASIAAHGRAGRDGERIDTHSGTPMAKVSVAVDVEREREGHDEQPLWLAVIGFNRNADAVAAVRKGDPCHVIGKLQRRRWTDRHGHEREAWECVADAIHSHRLARRQQDNGQRQEEPEREPPPPASDAPPPSDADADAQPDFVDDIPF